MKKKFPFIGIRELRKLIGRKLADRVKIEPVFIARLNCWVGWKSNHEYELFDCDALPHDEGRPRCDDVIILEQETLTQFEKYQNESDVFLSA